jgi:hypothetical protein
LQDEQEVLNGERYNVGLSASTNAKWRGRQPRSAHVEFPRRGTFLRKNINTIISNTLVFDNKLCKETNPRKCFIAKTTWEPLCLKCALQCLQYPQYSAAACSFDLYAPEEIDLNLWVACDWWRSAYTGCFGFSRSSCGLNLYAK